MMGGIIFYLFLFLRVFKHCHAQLTAVNLQLQLSAPGEIPELFYPIISC